MDSVEYIIQANISELFSNNKIYTLTSEFIKAGFTIESADIIELMKDNNTYNMLVYLHTISFAYDKWTYAHPIGGTITLINVGNILTMYTEALRIYNKIHRKYDIPCELDLIRDIINVSNVYVNRRNELVKSANIKNINTMFVDNILYKHSNGYNKLVSNLLDRCVSDGNSDDPNKIQNQVIMLASPYMALTIVVSMKHIISNNNLIVRNIFDIIYNSHKNFNYTAHKDKLDKLKKSIMDNIDNIDETHNKLDCIISDINKL